MTSPQPPARVEKPMQGCALFAGEFIRPALLVLQEPWAEGAREFYIMRAMTMLCVLLDDPEARRRVLDEVIKSVGAGLN
jgi:hypothetical protein